MQEQLGSGKRLVAGLLAVLACHTQAGCRPAPEQLVTRLADQVWSGNRFPGGSTALYPRAFLGQDWRVVLVEGGAPSAGDRRTTHAEVRLRVEPGSVLHFGYGIEALGETDRRVLFKLSVRTTDTTSLLFRDILSVNKEDTDLWHEAQVALDGLEGDVTLVFTSHGQGDGVGGRPRAHFSAPIVVTAGRRPALPNLIMVSLDTLRSDRLGIYGYTRSTSPNMDRLFSTEGLVIEHALSEATDTLRGHASMFTGLNPSTALAPASGRRAPFIHTWALRFTDILRSAGYRTAAFTENAWVQGYLGFATGFESFIEDRDPETAMDTTGHIAETFTRGLKWLERHRGGPFFLFLHSYQVHEPYAPPDGYAFPSPKSADRARLESDLYDGEITYTDTWMAKLFERVEELVPDDDTIIVVTSDHGEEFGEHGGRVHGAQIISEVVHVPIMFHAPGLLPAGVRRTGPMSVADLMPTLLDLMGLPVPQGLDGHSLADHLKTGRPVVSRPIFAEARSGAFYTYAGHRPGWLPPSLGVTSWPWRLVRVRSMAGPRWELYDLDRDPAERNNLYTADHEQALLLAPLLESYEQRSLDREQQLENLYRGGIGLSNATHGPETDPALTEKLRSLGYLGDSP